MYTLKSIAQRSTMLGAAAALLVAAVLPASLAFADALNPLTERSLMLSSSAPGFADTDGSGNSNAAPNSINQNYAPAGSGPNGKKTGQTFSFTTSSNATVKGFSLQYCTTAAGKCQAPGDNLGDARSGATTARETNATAHPLGRSDLDFFSSFTQAAPGADAAPGQFQIMVGGEASESEWTFVKDNLESNDHSGSLTGKSNYVTLVSEDGEELTDGSDVQIVFKPTEDIYITNPGSGSFFVKINTYSSDTSLVGSHNDATPLVNTDTPSHTVVDGGVTVANVMTDSIHITTKVLETMAFSVGTRNRDTVTVDCAPANVETGCEGEDSVHGTCSPIQQLNSNRLNLGNPDAEYSLETSRAWDVSSYWRLSSNSSGGATVYYSGNTLQNTVGDFIKDMPNEAVSTPGMEQFGLGFVPVDAPSAEYTTTYPTRAVDSFPFRTLDTQTTGKFDPASLPAQTASLDYDEAEGTIFSANASPGDAKFKFKKTSLTIPEPIAQQNDQVISCATAKMRYVANIAADTPAGVYTTKVNYLAAPQY